MPPKYKLTYFDIRARAEMTRLMFAAANVPYEDARYVFKDWAELKPSKCSVLLIYLTSISTVTVFNKRGLIFLLFLLVIMWVIFGRVSSSSWCLGWAVLFYFDTPLTFHIIIF